MININKLIKELRLYSKLTQVEFSKKIGVSQKTISSVENNHCFPLRVLKKIEQIYGDDVFIESNVNKRRRKLNHAK